MQAKVTNIIQANKITRTSRKPLHAFLRVNEKTSKKPYMLLRKLKSYPMTYSNHCTLLQQKLIVHFKPLILVFRCLCLHAVDDDAVELKVNKNKLKKLKVNWNLLFKCIGSEVKSQIVIQYINEISVLSYLIS